MGCQVRLGNASLQNVRHEGKMRRSNTWPSRGNHGTGIDLETVNHTPQEPSWRRRGRAV